jgi:hypothetical protein
MWPRSWSSKGAVLTSRKLIGFEKKMSVLKLHQTKKKIRVQWIGESRIPHSEFLCQLQLVLIYQWSNKA